jgi:alpha-tubulin suppressor-like RCC1 family protein
MTATAAPTSQRGGAPITTPRRDVTQSQIDALRDGDCEALPLLLQHPQAIHRLPPQQRQSLLFALFFVIGDSRSAFTTGVKKESAVAMRVISNLIAAPTSIELSSELKLMLRSMGSEELKKLKLERHLLSAKDDVAPAAVEFIKGMVHILRCEPAEFIQNAAALAKLDQVMQSLRSGTEGADPSSSMRRTSSNAAPPSSSNSNGAPDSNGQQQQQQAPPAAPGAPAGGQSHRVRALPSKPSSIPHEANPMFDASLEGGLMNIHCPNPVLLFAKHFGLGCIPRVPKYTEGGSLILNLPRKQSQVQVQGGGVAEKQPPTISSGNSSNNIESGGHAPPTNQQNATPTMDPTAMQRASSNVGIVRQQSSVVAAGSAPTSPPPSVSHPTPPIPPELRSPNSFVSRSQQPHTQLPTSPISRPSFTQSPSVSIAATSPTQAPQPLPHSVRTTPPPAAPSGFGHSTVSMVSSSSSNNASPEAAARAGAALQSSAPSALVPSYVTVPPPIQAGTASFQLLSRYVESNEGVVVGWGHNRCGELGQGNNTAFYTPRVLTTSTGNKVLHAACGAQYSLLLTSTGQMTSCGAAEWGQLGTGDPAKLSESFEGNPICSTLTPLRGFKPNDVLADVCAGYAFAVAVTENGEMYLWGNNNHGQCSLGSQLKQENMRVVQPMKVGMRSTKVVSVACGSFFVVILTATGTVLSWGLVSVLGLGPEEDVIRMMDKKWCAESLSREKRNIVLCPCKVSALDGKGVIQVAAGQWHVVVVCADGAVYSWGVGHQGRLGHGVASQEMKPRLVAGLKDVHVIQASCGSFHSCVLAKDGRVFVFGDNANGQCGMGGQPFYLSPTLLTLPAPSISVACGREHTTILLCDGDVMVCGSSVAAGAGLGQGSRFHAPTRILNNFITLSLHCGISHSFSLAVPRTLELIPVGSLHAGPPSKITSMMLKDGLISAALGANFTVVVNRNGETFAFGNGDWGQLGMGNPSTLLEKSPIESLPVVLHPQRVPDLAQVRIASVVAGYAFVFAVSEQQKVYFWGNNNHSQGGMGPDMRATPRIDSPTEIAALSDKSVVQIACGSFFVLALTSTMEVYSWGIADCCGHGKDPIDVPPAVLTTSTSSEARSVVSSPCKIQSLTNVVTIAAGQWHALALTDKGSIYSWGVGHQGRLGTGDSTTRYVPTKLGLSIPCASIGCGSFHSWALTANSDLYMWGDNDSGQCGSDQTDTIVYPQQVASDVRSISCGRQHSILITHDGKIRMAGLLAHQDKQYKCRTFDTQPQPPPLLSLMQSGKFALLSFSGPHHTFILAEKDRPKANTVREASTELRWLTKRSNGKPAGTPS